MCVVYTRSPNARHQPAIMHGQHTLREQRVAALKLAHDPGATTILNVRHKSENQVKDVRYVKVCSTDGAQNDKK